MNPSKSEIFYTLYYFIAFYIVSKRVIKHSFMNMNIIVFDDVIFNHV